MSEARESVERLVQALQARDMRAALATYAGDADWEVHTPGWHDARHGQEEFAPLLYHWFIARDGYRITGYQIVDQGEMVALRMEQHWLDDQDAAPCTCHHSHFFAVRDGRIQQQWMYCTGIMVDDPELVEREHDELER